MTIDELRQLNRDAWNRVVQDPEAGQERAEEAIAIARTLGAVPEEIEARINRAWALLFRGDYPHAQAELDQARARMSSTTVSADLECKLHNALGSIYHDQSELSKAIAEYQTSLAVAERASLPTRQIAALNNLGEVELDLRHVAAARSFFDNAMELIEVHGGDDSRVVVLQNLGEIAMREDRFDLAEERFQEARELAKALDDRVTEGTILSRLGVLSAHRGDNEAAARFHTDAIRLAGRLKSPLMRISALLNLGDLHRQVKQAEMAEALYDQALQEASRVSARHLQYRLHRRMAELAEENGDAAGALRFYRQYMDLKSQLQAEWTEHRLEDLRRGVETERLRAVGEIAQEITASLNLEEIFDRVYQRVNAILDASVFSVGLYDQKSRTLEYRLVIEAGERLSPVTVPLDERESLGGWAIDHQRPIVINNLRDEFDQYMTHLPRGTQEGENYSALYLPLVVKDRVIGVLSVQTSRVGAYSDLDVRIVRTLANFLAIAIDNALIIDRVTVLNRMVVKEKDELREAYEQISHLANSDHLTGLANRRLFHQLLSAYLEQRKESQEPLAVLFLDLDQFKPINDTHGHEAGDQVLVEIARRLKEATRSDDVVARIGGDEFVILLPRGHSSHDVAMAAEKLRRSIERPIDIHLPNKRTAKKVAITASTGFSVFPDHGTSFDDLVRHADHAMYEAKRL